jgi:hypothetical protein
VFSNILDRVRASVINIIIARLCRRTNGKNASLGFGTGSRSTRFVVAYKPEAKKAARRSQAFETLSSQENKKARLFASLLMN